MKSLKIWVTETFIFLEIRRKKSIHSIPPFFTDFLLEKLTRETLRHIEKSYRGRLLLTYYSEYKKLQKNKMYVHATIFLGLIVLIVFRNRFFSWNSEFKARNEDIKKAFSQSSLMVFRTRSSVHRDCRTVGVESGKFTTHKQLTKSDSCKQKQQHCPLRATGAVCLRGVVAPRTGTSQYKSPLSEQQLRDPRATCPPDHRPHTAPRWRRL